MKLLSQAGDVPIKGLHRLRFDADMESEYQVAVAEHKRIPRLLLFAFLGLCFALAPFYQIDFFDVASTADIWLRKFEIYAVGPLSLAAALATYLRRRKLLTSLIQSVAVVVLWVSPLFLRYLALHGAMQYPGSMVGIVVIAIAIFGGFNWYIFSLGSVIVLAVAAVQELTFGGSTTQVWLDINALALTGLIAVLGAYAIEVSHRLAWANGHTAYLLARTDALTGLSTRTDFDRSFPGLLQQARRDQRGIAIALIDVDHFDTINQSHGRSVGDEVLGALGLGLRTRLVRRPFDMAVRFTGDRMLVLWFAVPQEARQQLAATITEVLKAVSLTLPNGRTVTVTASCGISWLIPDKASSPAEILRDTECLMDQARTEGRNRIQVG